MLIQIIVATVIVSLVSLLGIIFSYGKIKKFLHYFISFAAASLLGVAFFDLIPEGTEELIFLGIEVEIALLFVLIGVMLFFIVERFIHWHHCDKDDCHDKPAGFLILTGDFVHNFIDGILIAGAFLLNTFTGIMTTITVIIHEIPQEFGDFSVLIHSGFSKMKALKYNFFSALSAVLGGILGYFLFDSLGRITPYAVLIAAGGFIYVALSDIVPSMHKHKDKSNTVWLETLIFLVTLVGFYFFLGFMHSR